MLCANKDFLLTYLLIVTDVRLSCWNYRHFIYCLFLVKKTVCQLTVRSTWCCNKELLTYLLTVSDVLCTTVGRCVTGDFGYLNCQRDVMLELQSACSGRQSCQLRVDDTAFRRVDPCHRDLKSHLVVTFTCNTGHTVAFIHCISKNCTPKASRHRFIIISSFIMIFHTRHCHSVADWLSSKSLVWVEYQLQGLHGNQAPWQTTVVM